MPSQKITADEFFNAFQEEWNIFCSNQTITGKTPFSNKIVWTQKMQKPGGLLCKVMDNLNNKGRKLEYKTEWYHVDILYVSGADLYGENRSYPSEIHALIEHEFNEDIETEMWKLIHWRAPLKVIISYDWADNEKTTDKRKNYRSKKINHLRYMLSIVNTFHPEAANTEYLFILATRETPDDQIKWIKWIN